MNKYEGIEVSELDGIESGRYLLYVNNRAYKVSRVVGVIAGRLAAGESIFEQSGNPPVIPADTTRRAVAAVDTILDASNEKQAWNRRLHLVLFKIRLQKSSRIIRLLSGAYKKQVAIMLAIAVMAGLVFWIGGAARQGLFVGFPSEILKRLGPTFFLFSMPTAFVFLFIHELGHSAALRHYGEMPTEIGAGFYFMSIAFFSNVNAAWKLRRGQRVIVSLGGIYFELIAAVLAIPAVLALRNINPTFAEKVFIFMLLLLAGLYRHLMPALGRDGYWIALDAFGIQSIRQVLVEIADTVFSKIPLLRRVYTRRPAGLFADMKGLQATVVITFCLFSASMLCLMYYFMFSYLVSFIGWRLPFALRNIKTLNKAQWTEMFWGVLIAVSVCAIMAKRLKSLFSRILATTRHESTKQNR